MFPDLEKLRVIALMEMIMKIRPNFKGIINVQKLINNLPSYIIKDLRNYQLLQQVQTLIERSLAAR